MKNKTFRFWVCVNGTFVKLALREGTTLTHHEYCRTDEGYHSATEQWHRLGDVIFCARESSDLDCDGPLHRSWSGRAHIGDAVIESVDADDFARYDSEGKLVRSNPRWTGKRLHWEEESFSQRDVYAERMGY